jgi:hypothetical protein
MLLSSTLKPARPGVMWSLAVAAFLVCAASTLARDFAFTNITDASGAPGQGNGPDINAHGDVAFYQGTSVYFFDRSAGTYLNITALPGAPAAAWLPKLNNLGNIVMVESPSRNLWLFEAASQTFTNISALPGYPGNSQAHGMQLIYSLNDANQVSFHSGDLNWGSVYVYTHATGAFEQITNKPDGSWHGRENAINNAGQVAYMGFPSIYVYDFATGVTTNISLLPGGPGGLGDNFAFNDRGDVAIFRPDAITYYEASSGSFLYLAGLPGFPAGAASSSGNDLSNRGEITFWRDSLYYFNPVDQSFNLLNNQGPVPAYGMETSINSRGRIALAAGFSFSEDIYTGSAVPQADFDMDGDVDLRDFSLFQTCFGGSGQSIPGWPACAADADFDGDDDVDLADLTAFQADFDGPNL